MFFWLIRYLDAFKVCPHWEGRIYTTPKVTDVRHYFNKTQIFNTSYDHRRMASEFMPGFNLTEIVGGSIKVVGIVSRTGSIEELEDMTARGISFPDTSSCMS